eukprot:COSAG05_NODE_168_length_15164_cov_8.323734_5_plen_39_part_00
MSGPRISPRASVKTSVTRIYRILYYISTTLAANPSHVF